VVATDFWKSIDRRRKIWIIAMDSRHVWHVAPFSGSNHEWIIQQVCVRNTRFTYCITQGTRGLAIERKRGELITARLGMKSLGIYK